MVCLGVSFKITSSSLGTSFAWKCLSHDAPRQARQGEQNPSTKHVVRASAHLEYNAVVWITALHVGNGLLLYITTCRSHCVMRRKVTVDSTKAAHDSSESRRPSVFERLGPGSSRENTVSLKTL